MVRCCSVYYCLQKDEKGVSFHRFPKDPERLKQWLTAIRREEWIPKRESAICSKHFTPDCFEKSGWSSQIRLSPNAVPTIFSFPSETPKFTAKRRRLSKKRDVPDVDLLQNSNSTTNDFTIRIKPVQKRPVPQFIQLQKHKEVVKQKNLRIRSLMKKNWRLTKKVEDLQSLVAQLKSENIPSKNVMLFSEM